MRRVRRCGLVVLAVLIAAPIVSSTSATAAPSRSRSSLVSTDAWPQLQRDASHSAFNATDTALTASSVAQVHQIAAIPLPAVGSQPAVSGGNVYVVGSSVTSYTADGAVRWSHKLSVGGENYTTPAVSGDHVVVVTQPKHSGPSSAISLNTKSGAVQWKHLLTGYSEASPTISGGVAYVADYGSLETHVTAFALASGTRLWRAPVAGSGGGGWGAVAVAGGRVFVTNNGGGGGLTALNAKTGRQIWTKTFANGGIAGISDMDAPVATKTVVYAMNATNQDVEAFDTKTGDRLWASDDLGSDGGYLSLDSGAGLLFDNVLNPNDGGHDITTAFDTTTGVTVWSKDLNAAGAAALANGIMFTTQYVNGASAITYYAEATGATIAPASPTSIDSPCLGAPAIANGRLYAISACLDYELIVLSP